ncbi:MAG: Zn-dependent hydrolase [Thalassobaculales bacterium]
MTADNLRIDGARLWASLMELARIGATEKGGVCRIALTDLDRQGRDLFVGWAKAAGCTVSVDAIGNIFARRPGRNDSLPPVMTGSHLDTQPTGGKFDGAYGVMAGLEVIRALNDAGYETEAPIEVAVWTNEEGARFAPAMVASGVFAGVFGLDYGLSRRDLDGISLGEALAAIGYAGQAPVGGRPIGAFFEAHIEQGPILEAEGRVIGVVEGAQGIRWYDVTITGREAHAGPTPMTVRRDALLGAARLIQSVIAIGNAHPPFGRATIGQMQVLPGSRNTIPGKVTLTVDLRHPDEGVLAAMDGEFRAAAAALDGLETVVDQIWHSPAIAFDPDCVAAVRKATEKLGFSHMPIVSGAGHDALYISRVAPTAMVFVPCKDGISHNEVEDADPDHLAAGCQVLLHAMVERANAMAPK